MENPLCKSLYINFTLACVSLHCRVYSCYVFNKEDYPMKNKLSVLLISSVLAMSLTSASASAFTNGIALDHKHSKYGSKHTQKSERFMQNKFKKMARYLDLNDEQREQAKVIHQEAKANSVELKESLKSFHEQSKILTMKDSFNEQAFIDLQNEYQETFAQMALIKAKSKNSFIKILTEEQLEKMKSHKRFGRKRAHFSE
jgi:protein CpxP